MKRAQMLFPVQLGILFGLIVLVMLLPSLVNLGSVVSAFPADPLFGAYYKVFPPLLFLIIVIGLYYIGSGRI